jgi:PAS domain S-box-containing protein
MNTDLAKHDKLMRDAMYLFYGYEVTTEGDSFNVVFHTPEQAIQFCVFVQNALNDIDWSPEVLQDHVAGGDYRTFRGFRIRMGVHSSLAVGARRHENTDRMYYAGSADTVAKALCNAANGGQILISGSTLADVGTIETIAGGEYSNMSSRYRYALHWAGNALRRAGRCLMRRGRGAPRDLSFHIVHLGAHFLDIVSSHEEQQGRSHKDTDSDTNRSSGSTSGSFLSKHQQKLKQKDSLSKKVKATLSSGNDRNQSWETDTMRWRELLENGKHEVIEIVPNSLSDREFGPIRTVRQVTASYKETPSGTVTFGFTYIEGAKALCQWNEALFRDALELHNRTIRAALAEFAGYEVRELDGQFLLAFGSSLRAVQCALACQKALVRLHWDSQLLQHSAACKKVVGGSVAFRGLRVQIGLCTGPVVERKPCRRTGRAEYFGSVLNKAARLAAVTHGGQVLASQSTIARLSPDNIQSLGLSLSDKGHHRLKGMQMPEHVYEVTDHATFARKFPGLKLNKEQEMSDRFVSFATARGREGEGSSGAGEIERGRTPSSSFDATRSEVIEDAGMKGSSRSAVLIDRPLQPENFDELHEPGNSDNDNQNGHVLAATASHKSAKSDKESSRTGAPLQRDRLRMPVLICDDCAVQQAVLQQCLKRMGFRNISTVSTATAALEELFSSEVPYRLAIFDVHTDEIDGLTACRLVRQRIHIDTQPTILLISADPQISIERAYADGADGFLQKPVVKSSLEAMLAQEKEHLLLFTDQEATLDDSASTAANGQKSSAQPMRNARKGSNKTALHSASEESTTFALIAKPSLSWLGAGIKSRLENAGHIVIVIELNASLSASLHEAVSHASVVSFDGLSWPLEQEFDGFWTSCASAVLQAVQGPSLLSMILPAGIDACASFTLALLRAGFERVHQVPSDCRQGKADSPSDVVEVLYKKLEGDALTANLNFQLDCFVEACEIADEIVQITSVHNGTLQYVNPAFTLATGFQEQEALGQAAEAFCSEENNIEVLNGMSKMLSEGKVWNGSYTGRRKGGYNFAKVGSISARTGAFHIEVMRDFVAHNSTKASISNSQQSSVDKSRD